MCKIEQKISNINNISKTLQKYYKIITNLLTFFLKCNILKPALIRNFFKQIYAQMTNNIVSKQIGGMSFGNWRCNCRNRHWSFKS